MVGADDLTLLDFAFSVCFSATLLQHYWLCTACLSMKLHALLCQELEPHEKFLLFHNVPAVRKYRGKNYPECSVSSSAPALSGFLLFSLLRAVYQQDCPRLVSAGNVTTHPGRCPSPAPCLHGCELLLCNLFFRSFQRGKLL